MLLTDSNASGIPVHRSIFYTFCLTLNDRSTSTTIHTTFDLGNMSPSWQYTYSISTCGARLVLDNPTAVGEHGTTGLEDGWPAPPRVTGTTA